MSVARRSVMLWGGGATLALITCVVLAWWTILAPAGELREKVAQARATAGEFSTRIDRLEGAQDRLLAVGQTMLARDWDLFEHRLRAGLSELASGAGLREVVVTNTSPRAVESPVARVRMTGGFAKLRQRLRARADFAVVRGRVQGVGSLDAALRALGALEAQAWVHRVEGVTIRPSGADRATVEFKADFAVLWAADLAPREAAAQAPEVRQASEAWLANVGQITARGLFRAPPEPAVAAPTPEPAPPPAPKPPAYDSWRLAGIMGGSRVEAVLVHTPSGRSRVLGVGDGVLGAIFEAGEGERAVFRIGDLRYEVFLGKSLADRRELK